MKALLLSFLCLWTGKCSFSNCYAFAPSKSPFLKPSSSSSLELSSQESEYDDHDPRDQEVHWKELNSIPLTPRAVRLTLPLSMSMGAILSQGFPEPALAKSSSSQQFDESLKTYFPGSIPSTTVLLRVQSTLRKRQYLPYNTIMATSLSSDEIVNTPTSLVNQLRNKLLESKDGGVYSLGGLAGIPFAGDAGMDDLLSHAPKDGRIIILFGPQVGIGKDGKVGSVERIGTEEYGADEACGVVVRAYNNIMNGKETVSPSGGLDLCENYIVGLLKKMPLKEYQAKGGDNYALAKITENLFVVIDDLIQKSVARRIAKKSNFWDRVTEVTMIGGCVINRGHGSGTDGGDDFFQPLMMKTLVKGGEVDLYKEVFGDLSTPRN